MQTIEQFCARHNACRSGREWALANCDDMLHAWQTAKPEWRIWIATRPGVLTDRELRLFAVHCARSVQHLTTDPRSIAAIDVAERHASGQATDKELDAAWSAASDAAWSAAKDEAKDAARASARAAARAAARDAARAAAKDAAWAAVRAAAWAAASDAARDAAEAAASDAARDAAEAAARDAAEAAAEAAARDAAEAAAEAAQSAWLLENTTPNFNAP
jgi:hypothetical protein